MRKLLPSWTRRAWLALFLQGRRRKRVAASVPALPQMPSAPGNLLAEDWGSFIQLSWDDLSGDELGFRVYRKVDGGSYGLWQTLGANVTGVQDSDVIVAHLYSYYVVAFNAVGESAQSNESAVLFGA